MVADQFKLQNFKCGRVKSITTKQLSSLSGIDQTATATDHNQWRCEYQTIKKGSACFYQVNTNAIDRPNETKQNFSIHFH